MGLGLGSAHGGPEVSEDGQVSSCPVLSCSWHILICALYSIDQKCLPFEGTIII